MTRRRLSVALVVLVLLGAVPATAQTTQQQRLERLKGLTAVRTLIEELSDRSTSCGITKRDLTTAASKALLDNGVRVDASADTILYVNVNTAYFAADNLCVSNVEVEVYQALFATPSHSAQWVFGVFTLADNSGIQSSSRARHGPFVRDSVFEDVEALAVDIRLANQ